MQNMKEEKIKALLTTANKAYDREMTGEELKNIIENDISPEKAGAVAILSDFFSDTPLQFIVELAELLEVPIEKFYEYYQKYKTIKLKNGYDFRIFFNKEFERYMEEKNKEFERYMEEKNETLRTKVRSFFLLA